MLANAIERRWIAAPVPLPKSKILSFSRFAALAAARLYPPLRGTFSRTQDFRDSIIPVCALL